MDTFCLFRLATSMPAATSLVGRSVNPVVPWKPVNDSPASVDAALRDAQTLRARYEARVEQHLGRKLATNDRSSATGSLPTRQSFQRPS